MIDSVVHIGKQSYTLNTSDVKVEGNISFASLIHLSKTAILNCSFEVASKRAGLQPYLFPSKVNLTMHPPHGGFTGIVLKNGKSAELKPWNWQY